MSVQVDQEMHEQLRERIFTAGIQVLVEKGYHDATFSDITARAGISRGLITYHFPDKLALVEELLDRNLDGIAEIVDVTGTPDERLAKIIDRVLLATARTLPLQRLALSLMIHPSTHGLFAQVEGRKQAKLIALEDGLRELFAARGAVDPALEEVMFRSVMEGVIYKAAIYSDQYPMERVRRRLHEMYELPSPQAFLVEADPPPVGRLRAAGHSQPTSAAPDLAKPSSDPGNATS
ncbi:TetR/AcrR family transcriptional regulator [Actinomadura sp. HBU206391]|uniref:TetR/AcrR family transcriptional regulator n=1 Tax=Actinomadura sp. HBU206391 TaxID=2731692 RepID=UPI001650B641|nr:TetR/AcrR family transcriptional regulator [Actinomadura sp. HBU206391]MBC6462121.1 TetR/AcrR family transcriptional regulator [Actinomadura sp. HBU206391]